MDHRLIRLVGAVIEKADRQHPADRVLREVLKGAPSLLEDEAEQVAKAVFSYFRWRGWLDANMALPGRIAFAIRLSDSFARDPAAFADGELVARAIPAWTSRELDVVAAWVRSLQVEPRLWLRARRGQGRPLAERLRHCRPVVTPAMADTLEYRGPADLFHTPEFQQGEFEVQDLSSQVVGFLCAPRAGETWWDVCAGEGGKMLHLSDLMENKGLIWASDRVAWRLQRLRRRAARARVFNYRAVLWADGTKLPTKTKFDGVLVDAPCSGIGTWQRNPHARWTTTPGDVRELAELQVQLLRRIAESVKPGGKLVYSVCTLARLESSAVADGFEREHPEFEPLPASSPLHPQASPRPRWWLWPQEFGGNGMFVAAWRRR